MRSPLDQAGRALKKEGPGEAGPDQGQREDELNLLEPTSADVRRRLELEGYIPVGNAPDEFGKFVQSEITRWAKVVKFSGAKPE